MQSRTIPEQTLAAIRQTLGNKATLALDLVQYDPRYEATMRFLFGTFFVCQTKEAAQKVAFEFKFTGVLTNGDVYDPAGTLSGGESANKVIHT